MFCPVCGSENQNGLRFCKNCGAKIAADGAPPNLLNLIWLFTGAATIVAVTGLFVIFMLARELIEGRNILGSPMILLVLIGLAVSIAVLLMLRQASRLLNIYLQSAENNAAPQTPRIAAAPPNALNESTQETAQINLHRATVPLQSGAPTHHNVEEPQTRRLEIED